MASPGRSSARTVPSARGLPSTAIRCRRPQAAKNQPKRFFDEDMKRSSQPAQATFSEVPQLKFSNACAPPFRCGHTPLRTYEMP